MKYVDLIIQTIFALGLLTIAIVAENPDKYSLLLALQFCVGVWQVFVSAVSAIRHGGHSPRMAHLLRYLLLSIPCLWNVGARNNGRAVYQNLLWEADELGYDVLFGRPTMGTRDLPLRRLLETCIESAQKDQQFSSAH